MKGFKQEGRYLLGAESSEPPQLCLHRLSAHALLTATAPTDSGQGTHLPVRRYSEKVKEIICRF